MGAWQQIAPLPAPRERAAGVFHAGKVYVIGGADSGGLVRTTFIYDPVTNTWSQGALVPEASLMSWGEWSGFSVGAYIHILNSQGKHYRYNPTTDVWDARTPNAVTNRWRAFCFQDAAGRLYIAGGDKTDYSGLSGAIERYDPTTNAWTTISTSTIINAGAGGVGQSGALGDNGRYYIGWQAAVDRLIAYDFAAGTVSFTAQMPPSPDFSSAYNQPVSRLASGLILALPANWGAERRRRIDGYNPVTNTWTLGVIPDYPGMVADFPTVATDPSGFVYLMGGEDNYGTGGTASSQAYVYLENRVPNAPVLRTMVGGALISTASPNRAAHTFNDPDTGDSQSKFELRYRPVGDVAWTTVVVNNPNPFYDFPAGEFTPDDYERQVRTWDAAGLVGPWCASGFFTAADPPAGPSITYPINGQDAEQTETLVWSTAEQDGYQVRRLGDSAGAPDEGVVYFDTGEVTASLPRSLPLTFETNGRPEHIQVRVKFEGLWSVWISVMVNVDYTEPMVPSFVIYPDPDTASLLIMITNPAPTGGAPVTVYNDVYITEGGVEDRKDKDLPTNEGWRYWTPASGIDYTTAIRIVAVAANGTTSSTP